MLLFFEFSFEFYLKSLIKMLVCGADDIQFIF
jgi:hypothetical protein